MSAIAGGIIAGALAGGGAMGAAAIGKQKPMQQGYDIVKMPQYSFTESNMNRLSDQLNADYTRLNMGQAPEYWQNALPTLRKGMSDPLYKTYYGRPGERSGLVHQAQSAGAMTGIGPKATFAQMQKQMKDYSEQESQIDAYLTGLGVDIMNQQAQNIPTMLMNMPRGPESQVVNLMGGVGGSSGGNATGQALAGLASKIPWENMFSQNQGYANQGYANSTPYGAQTYNSYGGTMGYQTGPNTTSASISTPTGYTGSKAYF